jgi:hypothetical protein
MGTVIFEIGDFKVDIYHEHVKEYIHVNIYQYKPKQSAKYWILSNGKVELAHNNANFPPELLMLFEKILTTTNKTLRRRWKGYYATEFYADLEYDD